MSEFLLSAGLARKIEPKLNEDEVQIFRELVGMANNLNQVARRINNGETLRLQMLHDLEQISQLLKKFE
ncbi:MAG: plasmid mobilization relaxosome protein MobC [Imperialibacter sp.]